MLGVCGMNSVLPEVVCNETNKTGSHAIVIGSGFGGLASAIRLSAKGYKVTVLEKLDAAGGRAYVYRQNGFTFDGGPTIITAPKLFEELWSLCGRRFEDDIDLREMNPFYRIRFNDGETFDCTGDHEKTIIVLLSLTTTITFTRKGKRTTSNCTGI